MAVTLCRASDCFVRVKRGYCAKHAKVIQSKTERDRRRARWRLYSSKKWRVTRKAQLAKDGHRCRMCGRLATQVDHLFDHLGDPAKFWRQVEAGHLQSLCLRCHSKKSVLQKQRNQT